MVTMQCTENDDCEEEMNFTPFSGPSGTVNFVTSTTAQFQSANIAKFQQGIGTNGQVVSMVNGENGLQYVRSLDGGAQLTAPAQVITIPITVPGAKPGDPPQTVQIQVLNPNVTIQQNVPQPKYQMQIPIQGFQQGNAAFLTLAYSPEAMEGVQLVGNNQQEVQVLSLPQDVQVSPQEIEKSNQNQQESFVMHQSMDQTEVKDVLHHNNNNNIKQEFEDKDEDSGENSLSQSQSMIRVDVWPQNESSNLAEYIRALPDQQSLPVSLQQFLKFNADIKKEPDTEKSIGDLDEEGNEKKPKAKKKKYRKPPKPAKPKPGQVVIARAVDGTTIYCCPECHMAYPDKDQLEQHLQVGHKIERRFICGICGAGLKRKEHLERHKLGHNPERPFICVICDKGFKRKEHLNLHAVIHSGDKKEICQECGKGFYRKDHLRKHTRAHQNKRAKEELFPAGSATVTSTSSELITINNNQQHQQENAKSQNILPEITIHVPTSSNVQVPVQITVPQHVISLSHNAEMQNRSS